jgi:alkanesulfonate monooxygenase SsuD/methylene tetrahydromethanopterin reductase-like flavin-dependent oxidoreductase (luciferase family)
VRFGLTVPNLGEYADASLLADLAAEAEAAGWDAFFLWDHILYRRDPVFPAVDPWVAMTAVALRTSRVLLGPMVTPLARRRPSDVARQTTTLDHLSSGRLVFGAGLGSPPDAEFEAFGEDADARRRGDRLDEALDILCGLWSGERFSFDGEYHRVVDATFEPVPVQRPRPPVWIAGLLPNRRPFRRAARFEGVFDVVAGRNGPAGVAEVAEVIAAERGGLDGFDIVIEGRSPGPYRPSELAGAGATWWLEDISWKRAPLPELRARIADGPPAL